jgi:methyl-accepting chemotaxis protein
VAANQPLAAAVGAEKLVKLIDRAMKLAGAPEDAGIEVNEANMALNEMRQVMQALQQAAKQITDAAAQQAAQEVTSQVGPALQKTAQTAVGAAQGNQQTQQAVMMLADKTKELQVAVTQIMALFQRAAQAIPPQTMPANGPMPPPSMPPDGSMPMA